MNSFRENLRDELNFQGITVKELAQRTGLVKGSLDNYLGARASIPPADVAVKIAQALNVSVEYLVTGMDSKMQNTDSISSMQLKIDLTTSFKSISKPMQNAIIDLIHIAGKETT